MKKKILIVGSKGMAGHVIYGYLKSLDTYVIEDISRNDLAFASTYKLDVSQFDKLAEIIKQSAPDYIINCVGILNQDAEQHPDKAILFNSYLPHFLAREAAAAGARLIHISTDCVFNGKKGGYTETDPKDGIGFYAQSKALGEVEYGNNITIRTSIIGPEIKNDGIGLFGWFMKQKGEIKGYTQAYWTGVTTLELAKAIPHVIDQNISGLIHLVNNNKISKYNLLLLFREVFEKDDVTINPYDGYAVDKSLVDTKKKLMFQVSDYKKMLEELKNWMETGASTNHK